MEDGPKRSRPCLAPVRVLFGRLLAKTRASICAMRLAGPFRVRFWPVMVVTLATGTGTASMTLKVTDVAHGDAPVNVFGVE